MESRNMPGYLKPGSARSSAAFPQAFAYGRAICYSGYRHGQRPGSEYPSDAEIAEDLEILNGAWQYLRLYDASPHAERVLDVIDKRGYSFKVMLGTGLHAEVNNPECPWIKELPRKELIANRTGNDRSLSRTIELAKRYPEIVSSLSIGNEASVSWNDHMVPLDRLISMAAKAKAEVEQPVTFCENYVPWPNKLRPLAEILDFLSVHSYPVWEYQGIETALDYTKENYYAVANTYPDKPVIITEAGWTTASNGRGITPDNANENLQKTYLKELLNWADRNRIITFVFEAFDESWKGSPDPEEPEKHWGIYREDRTPKAAVADLPEFR
jgi:exo-beta-1,3-glucanase (GH17 family)